MINKICKNCKLFDAENSVCTITVIYEGEHLELQVKPEDECHWIKNGLSNKVQKLDLGK